MKNTLLIALSSFALISCGEKKEESTATPLTLDQIVKLGDDVSTLADQGFTQLLSENIDGWSIRGGKEGKFTIENGELLGSARNMRHNSFLCSDKEYGDFIFAFQFKFDHLDGNSGLMYRALKKDGGGGVKGYQCEHDNTDRSWTAGLYDESRRHWLYPVQKKQTEEQKAFAQSFTETGRKIFKTKDWNTIVIRCQGNHLQTWLNGEVRVDYTDTDPEHSTLKGIFGFQVHNGKRCDVRWRNIFIKEL